MIQQGKKLVTWPVWSTNGPDIIMTLRYKIKIIACCGVWSNQFVISSFIGLPFLFFSSTIKFLWIISSEVKNSTQFTSISLINPHWCLPFLCSCHLTLNSGYLSSVLKSYQYNSSYNKQDFKGHYFFGLGHWLRI